MKTFEQIISGDRPVLVDFYAEWCAPCKMMPPILKELKEHFGEQITILKIDVDKNPQASSNYQIRGVPALLVFKNGKVVWRAAGVQPAHVLKDKLSALL